MLVDGIEVSADLPRLVLVAERPERVGDAVLEPEAFNDLHALRPDACLAIAVGLHTETIFEVVLVVAVAIFGGANACHSSFVSGTLNARPPSARL